MQSMLSSTRQLLGAETAELVLIGETSAGPVAHSVLRPGGDLETKTVDSLAAAGPLWERAIGDDKPIRVRSFTRSKKLNRLRLRCNSGRYFPRYVGHLAKIAVYGDSPPESIAHVYENRGRTAGRHFAAWGPSWFTESHEAGHRTGGISRYLLRLPRRAGLCAKARPNT